MAFILTALLISLLLAIGAWGSFALINRIRGHFDLPPLDLLPLIARLPPALPTRIPLRPLSRHAATTADLPAAPTADLPAAPTADDPSDYTPLLPPPAPLVSARLGSPGVCDDDATDAETETFATLGAMGY